MARDNLIIDPTQQQVLQKQNEAMMEAQELADNIGPVNNPQQALVREMLPSDDLTTTNANGWAQADNEWAQDGLTAGQYNDVYSIDSNNEGQDKVFVFYGFINVAASPLTTEIRFQDGTGATFSRYSMEFIEVPEVNDIVLLDDPIVYGAAEDGTIGQWADVAGDDNIVYLAKTAEQIGNTVTNRDNPQSRLKSGA